MLRDKLLQPALKSRMASFPVALYPLGGFGGWLVGRMQLPFGLGRAQEERTFGEATGAWEPEDTKTVDEGLWFTHVDSRQGRQTFERVNKASNEDRAPAQQG